MSINERISIKEKVIKSQLEDLRNILNNNRLHFNKTPNDWTYITNLSLVEERLGELLKLITSDLK